MKTIDVTGMGHALMDIIVDVDDGFIEKMGVKKGSMTLIDAKQYNELIHSLSGKHLTQAAGGSAANTIKGVSVLGGRSEFMGTVGNDIYGKAYEKLLSDMHVESRLSKIQKNTGISVICVTPDKDRTMMTYLGAAAEFGEKDVNERSINDSQILHIEGFFIGNPQTENAVIAAMKIAKESGTKISMDLSDAGLIQAKLDSFKTLLREYVDIVFVNEHEAKAFTGVEEEDAVNVLGKYCDVAIVKIGSRGSLIKHDGKLYKIPINKVKVVNTNGAGDAYAAGILYSIAHNIPLDKAGKIAAYISSLVVANSHATLDYSLKDYVKRILEE